MIVLFVFPVMLLLLLVALICLLRKKWLAGVLLLVVVGLVDYVTQCVPVRASALRWGRDGDLSIMTWNVCHNVPRSDSLSRDEEMARLVQRKHPDILVLQEHDLAGGTGLDSRLREQYPYRGAYIAASGQRNACLYSKYPIVNFQRLPVPGVPEAFFADVVVHGDTLRIVGCHLTSNGISPIEKLDTTWRHKVKLALASTREAYPVRERQALALRRGIPGAPYPVIVAGDLNDVAGSNTLKILQDTTHKDAWWQAGLGPGITFPHYGVRLDHILCPNAMNVLHVSTPHCRWSDHRPVVVRIGGLED